MWAHGVRGALAVAGVEDGARGLVQDDEAGHVGHVEVGVDEGVGGGDDFADRGGVGEAPGLGVGDEVGGGCPGGWMGG